MLHAQIKRKCIRYFDGLYWCAAVAEFTPKHPTRNSHTIIQLILGAVIGIEFGIYVLIRQIVNAFEWLLACESLCTYPRFSE